MKKRARLGEVYRRMRKPTAPPTRVQRDRREDIREEEARREIEENQDLEPTDDEGS